MKTTYRDLMSLAAKLRRIAWGKPVNRGLVPWRESENQRRWLRVARHIKRNYQKRQ